MDKKTQIITSSILYSVILAGLIIWAPWGENFKNVKQYYFYYLILGCILWLLSYKFFGGRFIRPRWKVPGKFISYLVFSFVMLCLIDHFAVTPMIGHLSIGIIWHYKACKKHDIDFWTCEPESKYLELTEKWGKGEFK